MRVYSVILVCCVVGIQVTRTQNRRYFFNDRQNTALRSSGGSDPLTIHVDHLVLHGVTGDLPSSYKPMTKADLHTAEALLAASPNLIRQLPNSYTINQIAPFNIELPEYGVDGKLYLNNLTVKGINQIEFRHLEVRLKNGRVDFLLYAPVSAYEDFELDGHIGDSPLHLSGSVSASVQDVHPTGAVNVKKVTLPDVGEVYQVEHGQAFVDLHNLIVTVKKSNTGDLDMNEEIIRKIMAKKDLNDKLAEGAINAILKGVNKILATVPSWKIDLVAKSIQI